MLTNLAPSVSNDRRITLLNGGSPICVRAIAITCRAKSYRITSLKMKEEVFRKRPMDSDKTSIYKRLSDRIR